jgi:outer membrane receptor protein involved in Fe transport
MSTRICKALACGLGAVLFVFFPLISHTQAIYGSLYGTVTDNTGAVVPSATITVTDEAKGVAVTTQSNESGEYRVEHLIPDLYEVKIEAQGFATFDAQHIQVFADSSPKVDAQLTIGGSSQTVTVSADAIPVLKTDRADVATTFSSQTVTDLPLVNRNFTSLQLLLPGAQQLSWAHAADENPQGSQQIQIDGQAFGGVAYELDGTDNQDPILGIIVVNPALDAVTEAKIATQNFDAEFGKAVSAVMTAQTKSGSNSFHGSAFDYRQSNANLARDPFQQVTPDPVTGKLLPPGLYNQFGGSIGGPIKKDRIFFFGDYQGVRQKLGSSATMTVPSAHLIATCLGQEMPFAGGVPGCDFSEYQQALAPANNPTQPLIYDQNNNPYPNSVIPAGQLSQPALNLLKLLQPYQPDLGGNFNGLQNNYAGSGTGIFNNDQWDERVDWQASSKTHVFERFSRFTDTLSGGTLFGEAGGAGFGLNGFGGTSTGANDSLAAGADIAISATLLTDFRLGYYRYNIQTGKYDQGEEFAQNLGIPGLNFGDRFTSGASGFNITDVGSTSGNFNENPSNPTSGGAQYGSGLNITRCNCPTTEREDQFQGVNNWTKIFGNHSFKMGADFRYARNLRVPSDTDRAGLLGFGNGPTSNNGVGGLGFATFVLGDVTNFGRYIQNPNIAGALNAKEFQKRLFFYAQDTWRATNKLTVNYGLRWELYFPEVVNGPQHGGLLQVNDGYLRVADVGGVASSMNWDPAWKALAPRIGVAYQLDPQTVIRAGYGRSFDLGVFGSIFGHTVTQNLPVLGNQSITATGGFKSNAFTLPVGPQAYSFPTVPSNGLLPNPGYLVTSAARPNPMRLPTIDAWNLSVQHSITPTLSVTLAYVGNKGTHTLSAGDNNNTNPNEAAIVLPAQYSVTGSPLHYDNTVQGNAISANGGTSNSALLSRYYGGTLASCQDPNYIQQIQAYQAANPGAFPTTLQPGQCGWTNSIKYDGNDQDTHYNALQATIEKQFTHGLQWTANYAWQRSYNWNGGFVTWDRSAVKGLDDSTRQQQFVTYALYQLPFGRNQWIGSHVNTVVNEIIGGWQLSPILTWGDGLPFTLTYAECGNNVPGSAPCYPNGRGAFLRTHLGKYDPVNHRQLWFNGITLGQGTGITEPAVDTIGNMGRNSKLGPGFFNTDAAIQKNFPIHESILAQFRMDAYNVFNHINPGYGVGPTVPVDSGDQYINSGQGVNGYTNPRKLQLSVRIQF